MISSCDVKMATSREKLTPTLNPATGQYEKTSMQGSGVSEEEHRLGREGRQQNSLWKGHRWRELLVVESEVQRKKVGFGKRSELLGKKK